ncbi:MAG: hypothetical protein ACK4YQ_07950 [Phenylobacterium sp.]|uniref:DUF7662 domain-containing protein n=1 Tax=Phenylobacterium sp. TaxID=1871053 RepID=UPI00391B422F
MSKYQPLTDHLAHLAADEWRASFAEVEAVLGFPLPKSASTYSSWWSNEADKPHKKGWLDAGWRVAEVDRRDGKVAFERAEARLATPALAEAPPLAPTSPVAVIAASPEAKAKAPKVKLAAIVAGTAALALGLGVTAARLMRRR